MGNKKYLRFRTAESLICPLGISHVLEVCIYPTFRKSPQHHVIKFKFSNNMVHILTKANIVNKEYASKIISGKPQVLL